MKDYLRIHEIKYIISVMYHQKASEIEDWFSAVKHFYRKKKLQCLLIK